MHKGPVKSYYGNKVVINIKNNPIKHEQAKHIEVDSHSKEKLHFSVIYTPFVKTGRQLLDVFTGECLLLFHSLVDEHGIRPSANQSFSKVFKILPKNTLCHFLKVKS